MSKINSNAPFKNLLLIISMVSALALPYHVMARDAPVMQRASHTAGNNHASSNTINSNVEPSALGCKSQSCKNRQHRRILRAECRLQGGTPSNGGHTCTVREPGWD